MENLKKWSKEGRCLFIPPGLPNNDQAGDWKGVAETLGGAVELLLDTQAHGFNFRIKERQH